MLLSKSAVLVGNSLRNRASVLRDIAREPAAALGFEVDMVEESAPVRTNSPTTSVKWKGQNVPVEVWGP